MRAAVFDQYGPPDVVHVEDVPKPVLKDDQVLVRVHAATVCAADWRLRSATPFVVRFVAGLSRPTRRRILGMEFSGIVESVGRRVTRFAAGDEVFGSPGFASGAHAEYVCMPETGMIGPKPANLSFPEAAGVLFGGGTALYFLRKAHVHAGDNVLVYGASGSVGVYTVQLAKHFGARVTAVCSAANLALVRSLGADDVVDYTTDDFSKAGPVYDIVYDTVGKSGTERSLKSLKRGGRYIRIAPSRSSMLADMLESAWISISRPVKVISGVSRVTSDDMALFKQLFESGKLRTVIDRCYPLDQIADAHRHAESGHKKGHVVVLMN